MYTISPPMLMISIGMQNVDIGSRRGAAPHSLARKFREYSNRLGHGASLRTPRPAV
jgi:hypothetical protein